MMCGKSECVRPAVKVRNFASSRHLYHYAMQLKIINSTYSYSLAVYMEHKATNTGPRSKFSGLKWT